FTGRIGFGGMGDVYLATNQASGRQFAAKVCHPRSDFREAFLYELTLWIDLPQHPNIAPCYFFRSIGDIVVIFAELYLDGSLAKWIKRRQLAKLTDATRVALMVARGLALLHDLEFVHRDFKPSNVLMAPDGTARVADFGVAAAREFLVGSD